MAESRQFRLRVTYCKGGRLALLSHLEVARALERTVRRADLPFAVTNGFSPHMKISFGAALPVGVGGTSEIFDLFLRNYIAPAKALEALQAASTSDLAPSAAEYVEPAAPAASVAFPISVYRAKLSCEISGLHVPETVEVVRKKKSRTLDVAEFLVECPQCDGRQVTFSLRSKPTGSLRPDIFIRECIATTVNAGEAPKDLQVESICRISQKTEE